MPKQHVKKSDKAPKLVEKWSSAERAAAKAFKDIKNPRAIPRDASSGQVLLSRTSNKKGQAMTPASHKKGHMVAKFAAIRKAVKEYFRG